ncbi:MAG: PorT family protein [Bacteroidales bacterium]|nr:PorT family protein [Bacteroidales bacterium]
MKTKVLFAILIAMMLGMTIPARVNSQVVIALLFGDKLNSPGIKFGLDGGIDFANLTNSNSAKFTHGLNLGLYLDILLKKNTNWYIHTGLILKSPMGGDGLNPYLLNDPQLDTMFATGKIKRELRYINVPILVRYKFKNQLFLEAGPMIGVLVKATDIFYNTVDDKDDISYKNNIYKKCNLFDAGIMGGIGYHFMKGTGMNLGVRYYYGFLPVTTEDSYGTGQNQSIYAFISIPIGAGEKSKAKAAAKAQKKQEKKEKKEQEKN